MNALELAKLLVAQNQTTANLIPVLAQILSTASAPQAPSPVPYQTSNTNASAALLPILASILGAASVTPQAQQASNANHLATAPVLNQMAHTSQVPSASISLPQMPSAPAYANTASHPSHAVPPAYLDTNSQGTSQTATNPFINQLKNVYDIHLSSLGQSFAPSSTHGQRTNPPLAIASKLPATREPISSIPAHNAAPLSLQEKPSWQGSNNEDQTDGSVLVGFLSSLKASYLKALQTPDEDNVREGPRTTIGEPSRVPTVTDASSVSNHGSSTEEVDWNSHRRVDAEGEKRKMGNSSRGPPRKRHKQKQQERRD